jgi:hypothetical protein
MNALLINHTSAPDCQVYARNKGINVHCPHLKVAAAHFNCVLMEIVAQIARRVQTTLINLHSLEVFKSTRSLVLLKV